MSPVQNSRRLPNSVLPLLFRSEVSEVFGSLKPAVRPDSVSLQIQHLLCLRCSTFFLQHRFELNQDSLININNKENKDNINRNDLKWMFEKGKFIKKNKFYSKEMFVKDYLDGEKDK